MKKKNDQVGISYQCTYALLDGKRIVRTEINVDGYVAEYDVPFVNECGNVSDQELSNLLNSFKTGVALGFSTAAQIMAYRADELIQLAEAEPQEVPAE